MNILAVTVERVHTHTHTLCSLKNKVSIFSYALLMLYVRDG